jgi:hypothetical protein
METNLDVRASIRPLSIPEGSTFNSLIWAGNERAGKVKEVVSNKGHKLWAGVHSIIGQSREKVKKKFLD